MRVRAGAVVNRGGQVVGAEERALAGTADVRIGGKGFTVVPQRGQQLGAGRQSVGDGDARVFELVAAQALMLGAFSAFLAEQLGLVLQAAAPTGMHR